MSESDSWRPSWHQTGDFVSSVPFSRWNLEDPLISPNKTLCARFGRFLENVECFDSGLFGINKSESITMDVQQRLLLQSVLELTEETRLNPASGVFVGIGSNDYESLAHQHGVPIGPFSFTAASMSVAAGRLSFVFGLKGSSVSVDTACSASMVGLHLAKREIQKGVLKTAVCCGVMLAVIPQSTMMCHAAGMLSPEGRCKVMDASADGYTRGEASQALYITSGDNSGHSFAILGSSVNTNGKSSSLTAPHGPSQQELIKTAVLEANLSVVEIAGLQFHANGTSLGDPIEVNAAAAAFRGRNSNPFLWSSTKGFTGHQEAASGVVNVCQVALNLQQRWTPAIQSLRNLNPYTFPGFDQLPSAIPRSNAMPFQIPVQSSQIAISINSFGAQGTNAHVIVAEAKDAVFTNNRDTVEWKKDRCWVHPPMQKLISVGFKKQNKQMIFQKQLLAAECAFMQDSKDSGSLLCSVAASVVWKMFNDSDRTNLAFCLAKGTLYEIPNLFRGRKTLTCTCSTTHGTIEVSIGHQKCFTTQIRGPAVHQDHEKISSTVIGGLLQEQDSHDNCMIAEVDFAVDDGYILHPVQLDSILQLSISANNHMPHDYLIMKSFDLITVQPAEIQKHRVPAFISAEDCLPLDSAPGLILPTSKVHYPDDGLCLRLINALYTPPGVAGIPVEEIEDLEVADTEEISALVELQRLSVDQRMELIQTKIMTEVRNMIGHSVHPQEPLMSVGLDSRAAMELRQLLTTNLGIQLPVTLLYDYQSVTEIAEFANKLIESHNGEKEETEDIVEETGGIKSRPSQLLKTLRGPRRASPLFLAAPGVANAQSAYFSFSTYLEWSDQPIYVLDKDNDMNIEQLARANAEDIIKIQPEGPYLLGGHSYGGAVVMEIAAVLESWGLDVGFVLIMDTPRPDQVRCPDPDSPKATEDDCMELLEMILGALGRDAVGLGSSMEHPRESEEWKNMTSIEKYGFFAPIWRVMRSENMSVEDVKEQIENVALAVKQGTSPSDMRSHQFTAKLINAQVLYFRAQERGACDYVDDGKYGSKPHGVCWIDLCQDLEVIDVPGDHFSLLRQAPRDMSIIVNILKKRLSEFGWKEQIVRSRKDYKMTASEMKELDQYLEQMGVKDNSLRARLQGALPWTDVENLIQATSTSSILPTCIRLNSSIIETDEDLTPLFVIHDANGGLAGMRSVFSQLKRLCFGLIMPSDITQWRDSSIRTLAKMFITVMKTKVPHGRYVLCGVGLAGTIAYEITLQLNQGTQQSGVLLIIEDPQLREAWSLTTQPWFKLHHLIQESNPDLDLDAYRAKARSMEREEDWPKQIEFIRSLKPEDWSQERWSETIEDVLRSSLRTGYGWEETLTQWSALYTLVQNLNSNHPTLEGFLQKMMEFNVLESQLEYLSTLKPGELSSIEWDNQVNQTIAKVSNFKYLTSRYQTQRLFGGETVFLHTSVDKDLKHLLSGWTASSFKSIASIIQPVTMKQLPSVASSGVAMEIETEINNAVKRLIHKQTLQEQIESQLNSGAVGLTILNEHCGIYSNVSQQASSILEHRTMSREIGGGMICSLPLWIVHDEQGTISSNIRTLSGALNCPCIGLELNTTDTQNFQSMDELISAYCELIFKVQQTGPYLVMGVSLCGAMIAHGIVCEMEKQNKQTVLILLDGTCRKPAISLHRPTWYSLFFALRSIGTLKLGIGDFVEHIKTGETPAEQLRMVRSFKPDSGISDEDWNSLIFNSMHKANVLEKLMKDYTHSGVFKGPVGMLLPDDRIGTMFLNAARALCQGSISYTPIELGHTEFLLTQRARKIIIQQLAQTIKYLLEM